MTTIAFIIASIGIGAAIVRHLFVADLAAQDRADATRRQRLAAAPRSFR